MEIFISVSFLQSSLQIYLIEIKTLNRSESGPQYHIVHNGIENSVEEYKSIRDETHNKSFNLIRRYNKLNVAKEKENDDKLEDMPQFEIRREKVLKGVMRDEQEQVANPKIFEFLSNKNESKTKEADMVMNRGQSELQKFGDKNREVKADKSWNSNNKIHLMKIFGRKFPEPENITKWDKNAFRLRQMTILSFSYDFVREFFTSVTGFLEKVVNRFYDNYIKMLEYANTVFIHPIANNLSNKTHGVKDAYHDDKISFIIRPRVRYVVKRLARFGKYALNLFNVIGGFHIKKIK